MVKRKTDWQVPTEVYESIDSLCIGSVSLASLVHFLQNYGPLLTEEEFAEKKVRMLGSIRALIVAAEKTLSSTDKMQHRNLY